MSRINGEKARAAIARRNRTKRRATDRARLAQIRTSNEQQEPSPKKEGASVQKE
ncbi:MAG TPA: hypothetical protein VHL59_17750 [Thermoanaerobaculia bacterium]|nr:hypothetical protein [Thermoanaerobaculia bacterium]